MSKPQIGSDDADAFLDDLKSEEAQTSANAQSNLLPLREFLKRRPRRKRFTKRDVALAAYDKQRSR